MRTSGTQDEAKTFVESSIPNSKVLHIEFKKTIPGKKPDINGLGGTVDESIYSGKVQAEFTQLTWADVKKSTFQKVIEIDCPQNKK